MTGREPGAPGDGRPLMIPQYARDAAAAAAPDVLRSVLVSDRGYAAETLGDYDDAVLWAVLEGAEALAAVCRELLARRRE